MPHIVYTSDTPPARKGWAAFDRSVVWALGVIGHPASFDEVARLLPDGIHYPLILGALRSVAEHGDCGWRLRSAPVVDLPSPSLIHTTRKVAA